MIDRGKAAPVLLVLGAGLAAVGSFEDTYQTFYPGYGGPGGPGEQTLSTNLWIVTTSPSIEPPQDAYNAAGLPVIITAVLMVVAAVFLVKRRRSFAAPAAMGAAGALAGIALLYVLQVRREKEVMDSWPVAEGGQKPELSLLGGTYLLVAAALVGLVGAALAQRRQQPDEPEAEVDEKAVVVHQLDADDDTPPFGIAVLGEEQQQETR